MFSIAGFMHSIPWGSQVDPIEHSCISVHKDHLIVLYAGFLQQWNGWYVIWNNVYMEKKLAFQNFWILLNRQSEFFKALSRTTDLFYSHLWYLST